MIIFETSVRISRPIEEVFSYVADPLNFPRWNSAAEAVRPPQPGGMFWFSRKTFVGS